MDLDADPPERELIGNTYRGQRFGYWLGLLISVPLCVWVPFFGLVGVVAALMLCRPWAPGPGEE
jgi:hypothetical protein